MDSTLFQSPQNLNGSLLNLMNSHPYEHSSNHTATFAPSFSNFTELPEWVAQQMTANSLSSYAHNSNSATPSPAFSSGDEGSPSDLDSPTLPTVNYPIMFGDHFVPAQFVAPSIDFSYLPHMSQMHAVHHAQQQPAPPALMVPQPMKLKSPKVERMEQFPLDQVSDFKHVIYNLLVEYHNNPETASVAFVQPLTLEENGQIRYGFMFNQKQNPEKKLPELYAYHIRKAKLELEDPNSIFIQDLYKFYLRASLELLSKYFEKRGKYMFLYEDLPLFRIGNTLEEAEERIRNMRTRARMMKRKRMN
eukprot:TRINITY_DN1375_c0_g1_i1.p1 TRINITY_DN1375_c0_g1~~TRINITY_DN1375_c0_g1_i1.p1  ORF type:complete len:304 (-),score=83.54 TRINITY_DN1375_c0_g1_i1:115-1026(-)